MALLITTTDHQLQVGRHLVKEWDDTVQHRRRNFVESQVRFVQPALLAQVRLKGACEFAPDRLVFIRAGRQEKSAALTAQNVRVNDDGMVGAGLDERRPALDVVGDPGPETKADPTVEGRKVKGQTPLSAGPPFACILPLNHVSNRETGNALPWIIHNESRNGLLSVSNEVLNIILKLAPVRLSP